MQSKKKKNALSIGFFAAVAVLLAFSQATAAQENAAGDSPWETFGINLGVSFLRQTPVFASDRASV
jgi:hypothetical protein